MSDTTGVPPKQALRLLDALRQQVRYLHYSLRTEQAYVYCVRACVQFHGLRHPRDMAQPEVEAFLPWLAVDQQVAPSTHKQALSAPLLLHRKVLRQQLPWMADIGRPRTEKRLPVVLAQDEVQRVLAALERQQQQQQLPQAGPSARPQPGAVAPALVGQLLYGTCMRLLEALRLGVKDVDFQQRAIVVREGKGAKDRVVMLQASLVAPLRSQLARAHAVWQADRESGLPGVHLPHALARKYRRAPESWTWFWVFPQAEPSVDPRGAGLRRHHLLEHTFQRAFKRELTAAKVARPATPRTRAPARRPPPGVREPTPCYSVSPPTPNFTAAATSVS